MVTSIHRLYSFLSTYIASFVLHLSLAFAFRLSVATQLTGLHSRVVCVRVRSINTSLGTASPPANFCPEGDGTRPAISLSFMLVCLQKSKSHKSRACLRQRHRAKPLICLAAQCKPSSPLTNVHKRYEVRQRRKIIWSAATNTMKEGGFIT